MPCFGECLKVRFLFGTGLNISDNSNDIGNRKGAYDLLIFKKWN
jgi:hypothetical protein